MEKNLDSGSGKKISYHISESLVPVTLKFIVAYPDPGTFRPWILDEKDPDPQDCYVDIGPCYYYAKTSIGIATYTLLYFIPTLYRSHFSEVEE